MRSTLTAPAPAPSSGQRRSARRTSRGIVQVIQTLRGGGLETMAVNLAIGLQARGVPSAMLVLDDSGVLQGRLDAAALPYEVLGGARYAEPRTHLRLARALATLGGDVVHTHHMAALASAALATRSRGGRLVHTEHAFEYLTEAPRLRRGLRWLSRTTHAFVVIGGEPQLRYYRDVVGVPADRLRNIANGVDLSVYQPQDDAARLALRASLGLPAGPLVGTVGRLAAVKNQAMLVRAIATLRARGRPVSLALIGDGEERAALEALARDLGVSDLVHLLGWRTDVARVLGCLDVFAMSSWTEGLPMAVLEAMAAGTPVVSTRVGDVPRVLEDGRVGRLVPIDDADALAAALDALFADDAARRALGAAARAAVERHHSQDAMVDAYLRAYGLDPDDARRPAAAHPDAVQ